jgi:hypothetical protein
MRERYEAYLRENPMWRELEEQEQERDSLATIFLSLLSVAMLAYGILFLAAN